MTDKRKRAQRKRYKEEKNQARHVAARLLGGYLYNCTSCGGKFMTKWGNLTHPYCDQCFPF